jgi:MFS transporter, DHA1 family, multidrug resistance protein
MIIRYKMPRTINTSFAVLLVLAYVGYLYNGAMTLLIPLFAKNEFNVSFTEVGLITSSFGIARLFADVPAGSLSDRYGKKSCILLGLFIFAISSIASFFVVNPVEATIARLAQGVGGALFTVGGYSLLADIAPEKKRGKYLSYYQLMISLGLITGPLLAGLLAENFGIRTPFIVMGVAGLGALCLAILKLKEPTWKEKIENSNSLRFLSILRRVMTSRQYLLVNLATFGVFVTYAILSTAFPLYGQNYMGLSYAGIGFITTISTIPNLLSVIWSASALDRFGRKPSLLIGFSLMAISGLGMIFTLQYWYVTMLYGLYSFGEGVSITAQATLSIDFADPKQRGSYLGVNRMFNDLGGIIGPITAGVLLDLSFPASPFLAISLIAFLFAITSSFLNANRHSFLVK